MTHVLDDAASIEFFQFLTRRAALSLEIKGLRISGPRTAYAICKQAYGLRGSRQRVLDQMDEIRERVLGAPQLKSQLGATN